MKEAWLIIFYLCAVASAFAQSSSTRNLIYFEAGGSGLFSSINYERQLTKEPGLGARFGVGFYSEKDLFLTLPIGINYLFNLKRDNTFLDVGVSTTWARKNGEIFKASDNSDDYNFVSFVPSFGYRKHTARDVMWRISITPVINKYGMVPWIGASIGKRF
jgi:hypothetical protein